MIVVDTAWWLIVVGWLVTALGAIGTHVLRDFSRHQLETYCRRRGKRESFGRILAEHDHAALAAESLQAIGCVLLLVGVVLYWPQSSGEIADRETFQWVGSGGMTLFLSSLVLLATLIWIPLSLIHI